DVGDAAHGVRRSDVAPTESGGRSRVELEGFVGGGLCAGGDGEERGRDRQQMRAGHGGRGEAWAAGRPKKYHLAQASATCGSASTARSNRCVSRDPRSARSENQ